MIGQTISHYRILSQLGEGGMGIVYVAEDLRLGRRVAVKLPSSFSADGQFHARFLREARAVSSLSHPRIAAVYDYGETRDGRPYIVMELVVGRNLSELLEASELTIARAVEITMDVAEALTEAHSHGVIHRDIKPSNVLVNERGEVKVLDFGLAKQLEEGQARVEGPDAQTLISQMTRSDVVVGTPLYLSPEQARGAAVDRRSDIFALGALLYECIAGRPAFSGANVIEIGGQVLHVDPPPPSIFNPRVTAELDRITLKALSKKPEARYQTAPEMYRDLSLALDGLSGADTTRTRRLAPPSEGRSSMLLTLSDSLRRPRLSPVAFIGALALVLLGLWGYARWRTPALHKPEPSAVVFYEKGLNLLRDGAYDQASRAFMSAIAIDEEYREAHAALAEAWMELDYASKAGEELLIVNGLVPDGTTLPQFESLYLNAVTYTVTRKYALAIQAYSEIAKHKSKEPQVHFDLGRAYERAENISKAIDSYVQALSLNQHYAAAYLRLGILHGRQSKTATALNHFGKAYDLYQETGNAEGCTEVLYQRGFHYSVTGKFNEAQKDLQQALELAHSNGYQYQQIQTLLALSSAFLNGKQSDAAEAHARKAVELAQASGMSSLHARGLVDLGNVFMSRSDYAQAEKQFQSALEIAKTNHARRSEMKASLALGSLLIQLYRAGEGLPHVEHALKYYREGGFFKETAQAHSLIGRAHRLKGEYDDALKDFERQREVGQEFDNQQLVAMSSSDIGRVYALQERYPEALRAFDEARALHKKLNNERSYSITLVNRAGALGKLGFYAEALAALDEVAALASQSEGVKAVLPSVAQTRAEIALSRGQFAEARRLAEEAIEAIALAGGREPETNFEAHRVRCLAQAFSGAARAGTDSCQESSKLAEQTRDPALISQAQFALAAAAFEQPDDAAALAGAMTVEDFFASKGQHASQWRALLLAARASVRLRDETKAHEYASRARALLAGLEQRWGTENFKSYLSRNDVKLSHQQLDALQFLNK
ncbi:MAG TPA: tetratricopeptide repeat protein [Pyrinomonadaceae bacterium]|jgi:tetratricopeptide (TPR) repeat protein/predicted Ser/Thr protein kinase|nr:tetratricopeptide repeat protein [Pyrinomonadaceae bacterium]